MILDVIKWDISPDIFTIGPFTVRYYGALFALGFLLGYYIIERMFKSEKLPMPWLDSLFVYVLVATVVGARLGHVFFYGWDYYSQHPGEILKVWHGGLASHGGAIGIVIAIIIYSKLVTRRSPLWILDRLVVPVALAAAFIRTGNLINSEIIGKPTDVSWAFIFLNADVKNPDLPRHPAQLYEAICYLVLFIGLFFAYWKTSAKEKQGLLLGIFLIWVFGARFIIEFYKENQEAFEEGMALNMGQILSIPFIIAGIYLIVRQKKVVKSY